MKRYLCGSALATISAIANEVCAEDEWAHRFDASGRTGIVVATGFSGGGALIGTAFTYRVTPAWRVGGYAEIVSVASVSGDAQSMFGEYFEAIRAGARAEGHFNSEGIADPYSGIGLGMFHNTRDILTRSYDGDPRECCGADFELSLGIDFHIGRFVSLGGVLTVIVPIIHNRANEDGSPVDAIISFPLLLRGGVSF